MFTGLNELLSDGAMITIVVAKNGDQLTVSIIPNYDHVKDEAVKKIGTLTITGTPEEFDQDFLNYISKPIKRAAGLISNLEEFEKSIDTAEKSSKMGKEKLEKVKKLLEEMEKWLKSKNLLKALDLCKKILEIDPENKKATEQLKKLTGKTSQQALFEDDVPEEKDNVKSESIQESKSVSEPTDFFESTNIFPEPENEPDPEEEEDNDDDFENEGVEEDEDDNDNLFTL